MLDALRCCFSRAVLVRNLLIALAVGTLLSVANQYQALVGGPIDRRLGMKILLNYVVPFGVSSISVVINHRGK